MRTKQIVIAAAASLVLASLGGTASASTSRVSPNTFTVRYTGYGATLAAAEQDATSQLYGDYSGCGPVTLEGSGQRANGSWVATIGATCRYLN